MLGLVSLAKSLGGALLRECTLHILATLLRDVRGFRDCVSQEPIICSKFTGCDS